MKRIEILFYFSIFTIILFSCKETSFDSCEFDKTIQNEISQFNTSYLFYIKSLKTKDDKDIELKKQNALKQIKLSLSQINKLPKSEEDENYLNTTINYLKQIEKSIVVTDHAYLELIKKDSLLTKEDSIELKNLVNERLYNCDKAYLEFQFAQKKFHDKFRMKTEDN
jgi:hypothetical protein